MRAVKESCKAVFFKCSLQSPEVTAKFLRELQRQKNTETLQALFLGQSLHLSKSQSIFLDLPLCAKLCLCLTLLAIPFLARSLFLGQKECALSLYRMETGEQIYFLRFPKNWLGLEGVYHPCVDIVGERHLQHYQNHICF